VKVPLGRRKVAVAGKISEGVRVHSRACEIAVFFVRAEDSIAVPLASKHLHSEKSLFDLVPLLSELEYPPEHF
jgi:hypothetical protein